MKLFLSILLLFSLVNIYSQDTLKIKEIDWLVDSINDSEISPITDTMFQDHTGMGMKSVTYFEVLADSVQLFKYSSFVNTRLTINETTKETTGSNIFYYHNNKLIKVDEYLIEDGERIEMQWYYVDDQALYYTLESDLAESRAQALLNIANVMIKQFVK